MEAQPPTSETDTESDIEKRKPDVCNVERSIEVIGFKWKLIVLDDLRDDEKRFNEPKQLTGASSYTRSRVLNNSTVASIVDWRR